MFERVNWLTLEQLSQRDLYVYPVAFYCNNAENSLRMDENVEVDQVIYRELNCLFSYFFMC